MNMKQYPNQNRVKVQMTADHRFGVLDYLVEPLWLHLGKFAPAWLQTVSWITDGMFVLFNIPNSSQLSHDMSI